jgi:Haloacid dehalogenase-like hydrolase
VCGGANSRIAAYKNLWRRRVKLTTSSEPCLSANDSVEILFDMDGVLYTADNIIGGAVEAAAWVRAQGIPHLFVTNTTSRSRAALAEKLLSFDPQWKSLRLLPLPPNGCAPRRRQISVYLSAPSARLEFADFPCLHDDAERGASYVVVGGSRATLTAHHMAYRRHVVRTLKFHFLA